MGEWFDDKGTLVLTDQASDPIDFDDKKTQFRATAAHEIAHALFNNFDPTTCTSYKSADDNPLIKKFRKIAGWNSQGDKLKKGDQRMPLATMQKKIQKRT